MSDATDESFVDAKVTYTIEVRGQIFVIENVPARVSVESGEQFFAPATVEEIHRIVNGDGLPTKTVAAKVFDFAA